MLDMSLTLTPGTPESTAIDASPLLSPTKNLSILAKKKIPLLPPCRHFQNFSCFSDISFGINSI